MAEASALGRRIGVLDAGKLVMSTLPASATP
jgi:hypothetical protein